MREAADCAAARSGVSISGAARRDSSCLLSAPLTGRSAPLPGLRRDNVSVRSSVRSVCIEARRRRAWCRGCGAGTIFLKPREGGKTGGKETRQTSPEDGVGWGGVGWCHSSLVSSLEPTRGKFFGASTTSLEPADVAVAVAACPAVAPCTTWNGTPAFTRRPINLVISSESSR